MTALSVAHTAVIYGAIIMQQVWNNVEHNKVITNTGAAQGDYLQIVFIFRDAATKIGLANRLPLKKR